MNGICPTFRCRSRDIIVHNSVLRQCRKCGAYFGQASTRKWFFIADGTIHEEEETNEEVHQECN